MALHGLTVDAGVLAAPPEDASADDANRYVDNLLTLSELLSEPWIAIYLSERASDTLMRDGLYPLHEQLKSLFKKHRITKFSVNDVDAVVGRLLQLTPHFETYFKISDVLLESVETQPDVLRLCSGTNLQSDLARCIVLIAVLRAHCQHGHADHSLILRRTEGRTIRVKAVVEHLEHSRDDIPALPGPPGVFEGNVLACDDLPGLVSSLDARSILLRATDDVGIDAAVRVAVCNARLQRGDPMGWDCTPRRRIGSKFHASLARLNATPELAERILRAIVETLEQLNMAHSHALRVSSGPNAAQLVRGSDGAKASRRDIDTDYHLHYWMCPGDTVELAWLSYPHDDFVCPE